MSNLGRKPIIIPDNIFINILDNKIFVEGYYGRLSLQIPNGVEIKKEENVLEIIKKNSLHNFSIVHGLFRTLVANLIIGVSEKFNIILQISGIGFKFYKFENLLYINIGHTNPKIIEIPTNITIDELNSTEIKISSLIKNAVTLFAAKIYALAPVEPYNNHGISYKDQIILHKSGKRKIK